MKEAVDVVRGENGALKGGIIYLTDAEEMLVFAHE
jgi:hypothetical protein